MDTEDIDAAKLIVSGSEAKVAGLNAKKLFPLIGETPKLPDALRIAPPRPEPGPLNVTPSGA